MGMIVIPFVNKNHKYYRKKIKNMNRTADKNITSWFINVYLFCNIIFMLCINAVT